MSSNAVSDPHCKAKQYTEVKKAKTGKVSMEEIPPATRQMIMNYDWSWQVVQLSWPPIGSRPVNGRRSFYL